MSTTSRAFESNSDKLSQWTHPKGDKRTLVSPAQVQCSTTATRVVFTLHVTVLAKDDPRPTVTLTFTTTGGTGVVKSY